MLVRRKRMSTRSGSPRSCPRCSEAYRVVHVTEHDLPATHRAHCRRPLLTASVPQDR